MKRKNSTPLSRRFSLFWSALPAATRLSKMSRSAPAEKCRKPLRMTMARLPVFRAASICSPIVRGYLGRREIALAPEVRFAAGFRCAHRPASRISSESFCRQRVEAESSKDTLTPLAARCRTQHWQEPSRGAQRSLPPDTLPDYALRLQRDLLHTVSVCRRPT